jgi:hypothetical protein
VTFISWLVYIVGVLVLYLRPMKPQPAATRVEHKIAGA